MEKLSLKKVDLFAPGDNGSKAYRIPSLLTTKKGTVIAGNDARIVNQRDNPNKINITIRRSFDNGETWQPIQTVVEYPGNDIKSPAVIDSSLLQDEETGTIWLLFSHTPGGVGLWNSGPGIGFDEKGRRNLHDSEMKRYVLEADGTVLTREGEPTDYTVNEKGFSSKKGIESGHIYEIFDEMKADHLFEQNTCYLQIVKSEDDGATWSQPIELNPQVKAEWMQFLGTGPGVGIQLKHGEHAGRLVFPIYYSNLARMMSCAVIYSDDNGKTWQMGDSPNDNRKIKLTTESAQALGANARKYELTESQVIELDSGKLVLYMRNHYGNGQIARATSEDGGQTWDGFEFVEELINPVCQISVIRYPSQTGQELILFSGPASTDKRENGVIRLSEDGGKTWPYALTIEEGDFVYSCLTVMANGEIGILYETTIEDRESIRSVFTSLTLEDIKG